MSGTPRSKKSTSLVDAPLSRFHAYRETYKQADRFCKEVQNFVELAGWPAINEMRYAGHHLLYALADEGLITDDDQLIKAHNHAKRACYEAGEAGILVALDKISEFKTYYSDVVISDIVATYQQILMDAHTAQQHIETRDKKTMIDDVLGQEHIDQGEHTFDDYHSYIDKFRKLRDHNHLIDLSRDELNKVKLKEAAAVRKESVDARRFVTTMVFTVIGTVFAVAVALIAWLRPFEPSPEPAFTNSTASSEVGSSFTSP